MEKQVTAYKNPLRDIIWGNKVYVNSQFTQLLVTSLICWLSGEATKQYVCHVAKQILFQRKVRLYDELLLPTKLLAAASIHLLPDIEKKGKEERVDYIFCKVFLYFIRNFLIKERYK